MSIELTTDQRRIFVNLKARIVHLRESDVAAWSPEQLARAESWYYAGGNVTSPDVPEFLAVADAESKAAAKVAAEAELASAARALVAASTIRDEADRAIRAASDRLKRVFGYGSAPAIFDGHVIIYDANQARYGVRPARTIA